MSMPWNRRHFMQAGACAAGLITFGPTPIWAERKQDQPAQGSPGGNQNLTETQEKMFLALQHEHGAIIQYINHCGKLIASNLKSEAERIQSIINDEAAHAQALISILSQSGVEPTLAVWPPKTDTEPRTMLQQDIAAEQGAINLYQDLLTEKWPADIHRKLQWMLDQELEHKDRFLQIVQTL